VAFSYDLNYAFFALLHNTFHLLYLRTNYSSVCMSVCECVCMSVCMCVYMSLYVCMWLCVRVSSS
jgi:hypothetical protein